MPSDGAGSVRRMARIARRQPRTKIATRRQDLGLKQKRVAELTGIPVRQLRRIENGEVSRVSLAHLVNLAMVLDVDSPLTLCEDEWLEWQVLDARAPQPPERKHWIRPDRKIKEALARYSPGDRVILQLMDGSRVEGKVSGITEETITVGEGPPIAIQSISDVIIRLMTPGPE